MTQSWQNCPINVLQYLLLADNWIDKDRNNIRPFPIYTKIHKLSRFIKPFGTNTGKKFSETILIKYSTSFPSQQILTASQTWKSHTEKNTLHGHRRVIDEKDTLKVKG